jgi:hypothetical protein
MADEMVVALGSATAQSDTRLHRSAGRTHTVGERLRFQGGEVPQARQTFSVVGSQPAGSWGFVHGLNDQGVALGLTALHLRSLGESPGLHGTDLVRLALERSRSARHAVDFLIDALERHRLATTPQNSGNAFLVASGSEAFLLEAIGNQWALQTVDRVRLAVDAPTIRQDWARIAPGLSSKAIEQGWWPADGSKLDFAAAFAAPGPEATRAQSAWQRDSERIQQRTEPIDGVILRQLLADDQPGQPESTATLLARLPRETNQMSVGWVACGPSRRAVFFPIFPGADLPTSWGQEPTPSAWLRLRDLQAQTTTGPELGLLVRELAILQARIDKDTEEWLQDVSQCKRAGDDAEVRRRAALFMQHTLELADASLETLTASVSTAPTVR